MDAEAVRQTGRTLQGCTGTAQCRQGATEDDNLLDNQDLCLCIPVSIKTLQRYWLSVRCRTSISGKVYYKASDVREFIKERFSVTTLRQFEKENTVRRKK